MQRTLSTKLAYYGAVLFIILFTVGPIAWNFIVSLSPEAEVLKPTQHLLPSTLTLENYSTILQTNSQASRTVISALENSFFLALWTLVISLPLTTLGGYALGRYRFKGRTVLLNALILTIVIPMVARIIPVYAMFREYNMLDSFFWTAVLYTTMAIPIITWISMNYFSQLPPELWQAAELDGFTEWTIFTHIILPVSQPIILTNALIIFIISWKQFMVPTILLSAYENRAITMIMSDFMTKDTIQYALIAACGMIAIIPPAILAILFRHYLISGLTAGATKTN